MSLQAGFRRGLPIVGGEPRREKLEGDGLLEGMEGWRSEEDKAPGWSKQDEGAALRRAAGLRQLEVDQGLHGALRVAPDLSEAHAALAERYRASLVMLMTAPGLALFYGGRCI